MIRKEAVRVAAEIDANIKALRLRNTSNVRLICREYSRKCRDARPAFIIALARELLKKYRYRWVAYELLAGNKGAFGSIGAAGLREFGRGMDSWWTVDSFARTLSGPAWLSRQIPDTLILEWARSRDRWWRRAALVSTVALNIRSHGGYGDTPRTLKICKLLARDHDDMVYKALSWALRALAVHDPDAVRTFLVEYDRALATRVKYEVRNKLVTGLKNPRRGGH